MALCPLEMKVGEVIVRPDRLLINHEEQIPPKVVELDLKHVLHNVSNEDAFFS